MKLKFIYLIFIGTLCLIQTSLAWNQNSVIEYYDTFGANTGAYQGTIYTDIALVGGDANGENLYDLFQAGRVVGIDNDGDEVAVIGQNNQVDWYWLTGGTAGNVRRDYTWNTFGTTGAGNGSPGATPNGGSSFTANNTGPGTILGYEGGYDLAVLGSDGTIDIFNEITGAFSNNGTATGPSLAGYGSAMTWSTLASRGYISTTAQLTANESTVWNAEQNSFQEYNFLTGARSRDLGNFTLNGGTLDGVAVGTAITDQGKLLTSWGQDIYFFIPEPSSFIMVMTGVFALLGRRRRNKIQMC